MAPSMLKDQPCEGLKLMNSSTILSYVFNSHKAYEVQASAYIGHHSEVLVRTV